MTMTDEKDASSKTGNELVAQLQASGTLDELFARIDSVEVEITGSDGLLPALLRTTLERGLQAEPTGHLGYEKGEPAPARRPNAREGTTSKTIESEVGSFTVDVPRDRAGTFTHRLIRKGQRPLDGLDDMITSLYAGGMTVREIEHHLATTIGVELSAGTISAITDAVLQWQNRPLEEFYPVVYLDAIRIKVGHDHRVVGRSAYIAVGVDLEGVKHVLGIWVLRHRGRLLLGACVR